MKVWTDAVAKLKPSAKGRVLMVCDSSIPDLYRLCDHFTAQGYQTVPVLVGNNGARLYCHESGMVNINKMKCEGLDALAQQLREGTYLAISPTDIQEIIRCTSPDAMLINWNERGSALEKGGFLRAAREKSADLPLFTHSNAFKASSICKPDFRALQSELDFSVTQTAGETIRNADYAIAKAMKPPTAIDKPQRVMVFEDEPQQLSLYTDELTQRGLDVTPVLMLQENTAEFQRNGLIQHDWVEAEIEKREKEGKRGAANNLRPLLDYTYGFTDLAQLSYYLPKIRPDLILSDYNFGETPMHTAEGNPVTGIDLIRKFKEYGPVKSILHSSASTAEELQDIEAGAKRYGYTFIPKGHFDAIEMEALQRRNTGCTRA